MQTMQSHRAPRSIPLAHPHTNACVTVALLALVALAGCRTTSALRARGAAELNCPYSVVRVRKVPGAIFVSGCGRRTSYTRTGLPPFRSWVSSGVMDDADADAGRRPADACHGCRIQGACIPYGALNLSNACLICDPATTVGGWSVLPGKPCNDGLACTVGDTCNAAGHCTGAPSARCDEREPAPAATTPTPPGGW